MGRFQSLIKTEQIGKPEKSANEYWQEIDSTNTRLAKLARDGACHGTVVMAAAQTQGRGRLGRTWISPSDAGLYLSVLLRPSRPISDLPVVTLCLGVAVSRAVFATSGVELGLKWVNDLILDGKKVGGILTEMPVPLSAQSDNHALVAGIGLNIALKNSDIAEDLKDKVTWLNKYSDSKIDPIELAAELCYQVEEIYKRVILKQEQAILDEWKALSVTLGQDVICTSGKTKIEGRAQDLSESGALIVRTKSGIKEIHAGEISICNKDGSYC